MKYGCLAFFVLLLILVVVLAGGGAALFFGGAMFEIAGRSKLTYSAPDAQRAQDKMYELLLRDSGHSSRRDPIVLTDQELSAFLTRYLERTGIPVSLLVVKLAPNTVEIQGQTAFRNLFKGFPFHFLPDYLPATTMDRPVWVTVRGTIQLGSERERGRTAPNYGQLEVKEFSLGYQGIGPWLLWALLGQERLRWPMPAVVETIKIEDGRIVITTGSRPSFLPRQRRLAASTNRI